MRFTICVDRVHGMYANGKYAYGGNILLVKRETMEEAKKEVSEKFKDVYYNHATIYDKEEGTTIERFVNHDWHKTEVA